MTTKGNFPHLDVAKLIIFIVFSAIVYGFLFSCTPEYHLNKYYKKGGVSINTSDTLTYYHKDSVLIRTKDTTFFQYIYTQKDTIIKQNVFLYPKTRFSQRLELRRFKDSLRHELSKYTDSLRYAFKTHKNTIKHDSKVEVSKQKTERKKNRGILMPLVILFLLVIIAIAFRFK
jgi:hypothetical protein